ncbi:MAG: hypothetical protein WCY88_00830 [Spongiibacteraceae bacterium]
MFKNKHVISALIITPLLAIIAYFSVDYLVSEQPKPALVGGHYELAQLPNCRYASGQCGLKNGNFKLVVTGAAEEGDLSLQIESVFPLEEAFASIAINPSDVPGPVPMRSVSDDGKTWAVNLTTLLPEDKYLRIAVMAESAVYYAETKMPFLNYETSFKKDFRPVN